MANKIETIGASTVIKCPADKFYNFIKYNMTDLVKIFPAGFTKIEVVEGVPGTVGYVLAISYIIGGIGLDAKIKAEKIDDVEKSITFAAIEGEVLQLYTIFKSHLCVSEGSITWTFEYEKAVLVAPPPELYVTFAIAFSTLVDAYLLIN